VNYYVAEGTTQRGPFNEQELAGVGLKPDMLVWHEGMSQWQPASQVPELQPFLAGQPVSAPTAAPSMTGQTPPYFTPSYATPYATFPPPSDIASKKLAAGLCGILLGFLGIHKFILGITTPAVIMLVVSLSFILIGATGMVCIPCIVVWLALPVMWLIGVIEGIIYLTKPDAEFYQIYMVQKRQWF
jgi:TM2 domain-containing membrane protein YozV